MRNLAHICLFSMASLALGLAVVSQQRSSPATNLDWPTFGSNIARTSASLAPTRITAANVGALQRQQATIDGVVDASLIYLGGVQVNGSSHDTFFGTTSYGRTFAMDANDGKVLWTFVPAGFDPAAAPRQITNSTPTADPDRQFIYAASSDGKIEKLAIADGKLVWNTAITRFPRREKIASPLSYFQGHVIAATGGYIGDAPPYQGHVAVLDASNGQLLHVWNSLCSNRHELLDPSSCPATQSAIWGRAGVVIDSATGDLFVATGNGPWDGKTSWGDTVIELDSDATDMKGNYAPMNAEELARRDLDLGSTSPVLLGGGYVAQGGKDAKIRVLSLASIKGTAPHRGGEVQVVPTPSGAQLLTAPAVLKTGNTTWMFAADRGATAAWTFAGGMLKDAWKNRSGGTSPIVAGGLLFIYDPAGNGLRVYEPETGHLVTTLPAGHGHWNSPIVVDGRIALPEGNANLQRGGAQGIIDIWR
jgi:outer membrane protein assembly factor BamB